MCTCVPHDGRPTTTCDFYFQLSLLTTSPSGGRIASATVVACLIGPVGTSTVAPHQRGDGGRPGAGFSGNLGRHLIGPVSGIASRRGWQLPARDGGDRRLSVVCSSLSGVGPSQEAGRGEVRAVQGHARGDGWRLKSANGQTIAIGGDRYKSKAGAQNSIDDVRAGRPRRLGRRPDLIATGPGMARRPARDGHDLRRPHRDRRDRAQSQRDRSTGRRPDLSRTGPVPYPGPVVDRGRG